MHSFTLSSIAFWALAAQRVASFAVPVDMSIEGPLKPRGSLPFNQIVAFGDELSDNGNGSYAHGITNGTNDHPNTGPAPNVYGFGTWTNGPVAVSYLADLYDVPLRDLAWGGCCGGGSFGATIDNSYTPAAAQYNGAPVPSVNDQIHGNYSLRHPNIHNALQFIWVGENDLSKQTDAFWEGDAKNSAFANEISSRIVADAEWLVANGAPFVFVAGIYPKHLAPVTTTYLCPDGGCVEAWGKIIQNANSAIQTALSNSKYSKQFIYYDVFTYMVNVINAKDTYGFTTPLGWICDGGGDANWTACTAGKHYWDGAHSYFWMNFIQPTTRVHQMIAQDMKNTIDKFIA